jgi:hypothetical protein
MAQGLSVGAAGYQAKSDDFFRPEVVAPKIMLSYFCESQVSQLARTNFMGDQNLRCHSKIHWAFFEDPQEMGEQCDYPENGPSYEIPDPDLQHRETSIDQSFRFHKKVDKREKLLMCERWSMYEMALFEMFKRQWHWRIDAHFYTTVFSSAAVYNMGPGAGYQSASLDLGSLTNPVSMLTNDATMRLFDRMLLVAQERGMICDPTKGYKNMGDGNGMVMVVDPFTAAAIRRMFIGLGSTCCGGEVNPLYTGFIPNPFGLKIYVPPRLPYNINGAGKRVQYIALWDSSRVAFPFESLYLDWTEQPHHWVLAGEIIWDTHVFDPGAIIVAAVTHQ